MMRKVIKYIGFPVVLFIIDCVLVFVVYKNDKAKDKIIGIVVTILVVIVSLFCADQLIHGEDVLGIMEGSLMVTNGLVLSLIIVVVTEAIKALKAPKKN